MINFLALQQEAFGLDISDLSLKIIKLKKRGNGLQLASWYQTDIRPGIIEKGIIQDENELARII